MPYKPIYTVDQLIKKLERIKAEYGDILVMVEGNYVSPEYVVNVGVHGLSDPNEPPTAVIQF